MLPNARQIQDYLAGHLDVAVRVTSIKAEDGGYEIYRVYVQPLDHMTLSLYQEWLTALNELCTWSGPMIDGWTVGDGDDSLAVNCDPTEGVSFWLRKLGSDGIVSKTDSMSEDN